MKSSIKLPRGQVQSPFIQISPIDFYNLTTYEVGAMYLIQGKEIGLYAVDSSSYIKAWGTNEPFEPFSLTVNASDGTFTIPTNGTGYDYTVDWGDGIIETGVGDGDKSHTYASSGQYTIKIYGHFPTIYFNNSGDALKVLSIESWGDIEWSSFENSFWGCYNLNNITTSAPIIIGGSLYSAFRDCSSLTTLDFSAWDVSSVTNMAIVFYGCSSLTTLDVSNWDVSSVTTMYTSFRDCSSLTTLDVSNWDVSSVANMTSMFQSCSSLTALDVSSWDVSSVTTMNTAFRDCSSLTTLDVSNWDVSSVTNMRLMFYGCSSLTTLDFSAWDVSSVTTMLSMFIGTNFQNVSNYTAALQYWATLQLQTGVESDFGAMEYDASATAARQYVIDTFGWTITDGGPSGN